MKTGLNFEKNIVVLDVNFRSWLYTIMHSLFINNFFKVFQEQISLDTNNQFSEDIYDLREMRKTLNILPEKYRELYCMSMAGLDHKSMAKILNLPVHIVKARIFFIKQHFSL